MERLLDRFKKASTVGTVSATRVEIRQRSGPHGGGGEYEVFYVDYAFQIDVWTFNHSRGVGSISDWQVGDKKAVTYPAYAFPSSSSVSPRSLSDQALELLGPPTWQIKDIGERTIGTALGVIEQRVGYEIAFGIKYKFSDTEGKTRKNITWDLGADLPTAAE